MTFYNIIFGLLFIGAFREVIFALGGQPGWGTPDWRLFCRAAILSILVFSDTIYTAVVIEDKKRTYSVEMKLLDLFSFILLSFAVVLLNPVSNDMFEVNVTGTLQQVVHWTRWSVEAMFWAILAAYMLNIIGWNRLMGIDRIMARHRWVKRVQPALAIAFTAMTVLALLAPTSPLLVAGRWILLGVAAVYLLVFKPFVCHVLDKYVELRPLTDADAAQIHNWPKYKGKLAELDYGLRKDGGWLTLYPAAGTERGRNERYGAWQGDKLVGFSILGDIKNDAGEFYVALHPESIGQHIGREVTERMVARGFENLELKRIYLKVREHHPAQHMYAEVGFRRGAKFQETVNGQPVTFLKMEITPRRSRLERMIAKIDELGTKPATTPPRGQVDEAPAAAEASDKTSTSAALKPPVTPLSKRDIDAPLSGALQSAS